MHEVLVNCLFKLAQEKVWLGELIFAAKFSAANCLWRFSQTYHAFHFCRGTSEPLKSPVQSSSFLLKARELQERARQQAAAQDDSAVFAQSKSATSFKMKPRQRRIESFQ